MLKGMTVSFHNLWLISELKKKKNLKEFTLVTESNSWRQICVTMDSARFSHI